MTGLGPQSPAQVKQLVGLGIQHLRHTGLGHLVVVKPVPAVVPLGKVGIVARVKGSFVHDHGEQVVRIRHGVGRLVLIAARQAALTHIQREGESHLDVHFGAAQRMLVPLQLHTQHGRQRMQRQLLDGLAALLAVAASVCGLGQLLRRTVPHEAALQRVHRRVRHRCGLVALFSRLLFLAAVGRRVGAHLETEIQKRLARMRHALARRARHTALQAPAKRAVHHTGARRIMVGRAGLIQPCGVRMLTELRERRCIVPGACWQLDPVVRVHSKREVNAIERTNEHFVRIVLSRSRELRGGGVHPDGVQERRGAVGRGRIIPREKLGEQLVHLAREAIAPRRAQFCIVPVAQKVVAQQRIMKERLQNHIQKTRRPHIAQTARHPTHTGERLTLRGCV